METTACCSQTLSLLDRLPLGACVVDGEELVVFWNRALERWSGLFRYAVTGTNLWDHYPMLRDGIQGQLLRRVLEGGPPILLSSALHRQFLPLRRSDGQTLLQRTTLTPVPQAGRACGLAMIIIEDVTDMHCQTENNWCLQEKLRTHISARIDHSGGQFRRPRGGV